MTTSTLGISGQLRNQIVNVSRNKNTITLRGSEEPDPFRPFEPSVQLLEDELKISGLQSSSVEGYEIGFGGKNLELRTLRDTHYAMLEMDDMKDKAMPFPEGLSPEARRSFAINFASTIVGVPLHESMWQASPEQSPVSPPGASTQVAQAPVEANPSAASSLSQVEESQTADSLKRFGYHGLSDSGIYSAIHDQNGDSVNLVQERDVDIVGGVLVEKDKPRSQIEGRLNGVDLQLTVTANESELDGAYSVRGKLNGEPYRATIQKKDEIVQTDLGIAVNNGEMGVLKDDSGTMQFKKRSKYEDLGGIKIQAGSYTSVESAGQKAKLDGSKELTADGNLSPKSLALALALKPFLS